MAILQIKVGGETTKSRFQPVTVGIDWDKLPEASRDFVIRYGIKQWLADGTVGEKVTTQATFTEAINTRKGKLEAGDFSRTRGESGPVNDPETLAGQMAKAIVVDAFKDQGKKLPEKEQLAKVVAAYFAKNKAALVKDATAQIKARKDRAAAILEGEGDDILAALGLGPDEDVPVDGEPDETDEGEDTETPDADE